MPGKCSQPLINGYQVGKRRVIDGCISCIECGEFKPANGEHFTATGKRLCYRCRPCETERVGAHQMTQRIEKHGLLSEIASLQNAERELERRRARLTAYIDMTKKDRTPGPWHIGAPPNGTFTVGTAEGKATALCFTQSDARAVAALPDLIDVLTVLIERIAQWSHDNPGNAGMYHAMTAEAHRAIKKAKGL